MNKDMSVNKDRFAYRGYYIVKNPMTEIWYVSKGGTHITSASSLLSAEQEIDLLLGVAKS